MRYVAMQVAALELNDNDEAGAVCPCLPFDLSNQHQTLPRDGCACDPGR
jgi:hypothetical protein